MARPRPLPDAPTRHNDADETRNNILEVAAREFADKGLDGARIDEIAEKTASSKRMIYYYFGGKDELYRAVLERAYEHIRNQEQAANFASLPPDQALLDGFREMGERAEEMTRTAMQALQSRDGSLAESLMDLDELIDRANKRVVGRVLELGQLNLEWGIRMILVSRCLERIGDNAVDIGEQTSYLVTGDFREFTDASH